jgi:23S rRNA pseudouridine955/2504/2580 synthase
MIGHPVLGDLLYSTNRSRTLIKEGGIERQMLHAESLTFKLPGGERRSFSAPLPEDMASVVSRLRTGVT